MCHQAALTLVYFVCLFIISFFCLLFLPSFLSTSFCSSSTSLYRIYRCIHHTFPRVLYMYVSYVQSSASSFVCRVRIVFPFFVIKTLRLFSVSAVLLISHSQASKCDGRKICSIEALFCSSPRAENLDLFLSCVTSCTKLNLFLLFFSSDNYHHQ